MKSTKLILILLLTAVIVYGFINREQANVVKQYGYTVVGKDKVPVGTEVGNKAPELNYKSPDGKEISLSSLKGKMVLIDFWASWCGPCRRENPSVVAAYNKYKDSKFKNGKGFTIYSVSLDKSAEAWKKAIEADGLIWEYHVSDLGYWNSEPAKLYGVMGIPTNWLIDGNGIIVAKNLRGQALETTLESFVKGTDDKK